LVSLLPNKKKPTHGRIEAARSPLYKGEQFTVNK